MASFEDRLAAAGNGKQLRLVAALLAIVTALLIAGYYFFLRADYAVLFSDVRPADASAIVAELERRQISHELRDGGTTILVPADQVAQAQIGIAGSSVPQRGTAGFELFNESDMGLTDFAQRINYQRALQGELARTIMQMDGIEAARVHLALPERSLFRGNRSEPRAAVTVTPKRGHLLDEARVSGIQRLVAAAIPELTLENVVVLDDFGRVVSPAVSADAMLTPAAEEEGAVRRYFRGRARQALASALPGVEWDVRVAIGARQGEPSGGRDVSGNSLAGPPSERRNFQLNILIATPVPLTPDRQQQAREAVAAATGLDESAGDTLTFRTGPSEPHMVAPPMADRLPLTRPGTARPSQADVTLLPIWLWWILALCLATGGAIVALRLRTGQLPLEQREDFLARIRRQLRLASEGSDG